MEDAAINLQRVEYLCIDSHHTEWFWVTEIPSLENVDEKKLMKSHVCLVCHCVDKLYTTVVNTVCHSSFENVKSKGKKTHTHEKVKENDRICWVGICMRPIIVVKRFHDIHRRIELMSSVCYFLSQPKIPISLDGDEMNFRLY